MGWTGRWMCFNYGNNYYQEKDPNSQRNIIKSVRNPRIGNLNKDTEQGMVIITQAVVAKVNGIEDLNVKMDNYGYYIDMYKDIYGRINVEYSSLLNMAIGILKYELWKFNNRRICDTFILLGLNKDKSDIERVYIIPKKMIEVAIIGIYKNNSKYEKFRFDKRIYSDMYCDIMFYIEDKVYFGIEDIKDWMNHK